MYFRLAALFLFSVTWTTGVANGQSTGLSRHVVTGFTEPYRTIDVAAAEMGILSEVAVREGDTVDSGTILARLNEDVLKASLAMVEESKNAKGKLNSALAELKLQEEHLGKLVGLQERQHASQMEIDRAKSQWEIAKARVEAVQDELRLKAFEMARIEAQLEQRRLRSPIDGVVTNVAKEEGEFVSASDPVVATVVQLDSLLVIFSVPQGEARRMMEGQRLPLTIGEIPVPAKGVVEFVSPTADAQSGTCRVKVRIDNAENRWQSGEVCRWDLSVSAGQAAVPETSQVAHARNQ